MKTKQNRTTQLFVSLAAAAAGAGTALAAAAPAVSQPNTVADGAVAGTWRSYHEHVLGTSLEMAISAPSRQVARRAERQALAEFARRSGILSAWDRTSEFSRWQRTAGRPVRISPELMDVLQRFDRWHGATGGVLTASSEAAGQLWREAARRGHAPSDAELAAAVHAMAQPHWRLNPAAGTATRLSSAPLVLASFTKSLIAQKVAEVALHAGATGVMLNVGGDIVTRGSLTQRVDIANPHADAENDPAIDTVVLQDRAIATSGSYRRGFEVSGVHHSHIVDPRTALPAVSIASSSVIAHDAATAGALATALSVLTPRESQALMEQHPGAQYLLVTREGERIASPGWAGYQDSRLQPAAYRVAMGAAVPAPAGAAWNQSMELMIKLDLPRIENPRYRRPYVAVWIEDKDRYPVRTVALWFKNPRWLNELKQWYRDDQVRNLSEGSDISGTVSSATRAPGSYTLRWDGKDNAGKLVKAGTYTVVIEAAREHGGHSVVRQEFDFNGTAQAKTLPASEELGAVQLDYRKH